MSTFIASHIRFWENVPSCPIRLISKVARLSHCLNCRTEEYLIRFTLVVPSRGRLPVLAKISSHHTHVIGETCGQKIEWSGRLGVDCALAYHMSIPYWQFKVVFDEDTRLCEITMQDEGTTTAFLNPAFEHFADCGLCKRKLEGLDSETSRGA